MMIHTAIALFFYLVASSVRPRGTNAFVGETPTHTATLLFNKEAETAPGSTLRSIENQSLESLQPRVQVTSRTTFERYGRSA